jgi:hypothetical protein
MHRRGRNRRWRTLSRGPCVELAGTRLPKRTPALIRDAFQLEADDVRSEEYFEAEIARMRGIELKIQPGRAAMATGLT